MDFRKYQHIERFGTKETQGIDIGTCHVFPKIDGTNASIWLKDDLTIGAGSRNRDLTQGEDNHGFREWVMYHKDQFSQLLVNNIGTVLYGEWLVPHTFKKYRDEAWNNFYVFDVWDEARGRYLSYDEYSTWLYTYDIKTIPPLRIIENPTLDKLNKLLQANTYLVMDGEGAGEGLVIKNYDYRNPFGRQTWAKIVRNEFKENHWNNDPIKNKDKDRIEKLIVDKYVTKVLVDKEFAKIDVEVGWSSKLIPRLLNTVYYCLVKEECWNFVKEYKRPVIDFKKLFDFSVAKTKHHKPEIF